MEFELGLNQLNVPIELIEKIINFFAGEMIYIPKKINAKKQRDAEIKAKFKGDNYCELAKEFNLTTRHVRTIVSEN
jgi:Mor family transcriptional regulator